MVSIKKNENVDVKGPFEALLGHFNVLLLHASISELDNGALFSSSGTSKFSTSSYPGWIKSPHVVNLGIQKISDLNSLTIFIRGGGVFWSKLWSSQI